MVPLVPLQNGTVAAAALSSALYVGWLAARSTVCVRSFIRS